MSDSEPPIPLPPGASVELLDEDVALIRFRPLTLERPPSLTDSEWEVAVAVFDSMSNAEIAEARGVSARTVAKQLGTVYQKLGVVSRAELVLRLMRPAVESDGAPE